MHDHNTLTENLDDFVKRLATRTGDFDLEAIAAMNVKRKGLQKTCDDLVHEQRLLSKQIGPKIGKGEDVTELKAQVGAIKEREKAAEAERREVEAQLDAKALLIPNLPHPEAPLGGEDDGVITAEWGEAKTFDFDAKDHVTLCETTGLVELGERSTKLAGSSFVTYMGQGARLARALINYFLDLHTADHGYTEVSPPFVVNARALTGTGQLPKFKDDLYAVSDGLYLIPTAEVPVTNLFQDSIIPGEQLPVAYCAYTPCFRREAGAAGKMTRGLKRLHQFDKVELVRFCRPEDSDAEHKKLLSHAEEPLRRLGLRYRIKELATGDIGFSAARCFDIEAHAPASDEWLEVSSVSTFGDFQARRAKIRFKDKKSDANKKPKAKLVHTLNGSGLALPRVIIAILETYQRADGTIEVPEVLRPYFGGAETIG
jgi:seryl-tRNA synthetase